MITTADISKAIHKLWRTRIAKTHTPTNKPLLMAPISLNSNINKRPLSAAGTLRPPAPPGCTLPRVVVRKTKTTRRKQQQHQQQQQQQSLSSRIFNAVKRLLAVSVVLALAWVAWVFLVDGVKLADLREIDARMQGMTLSETEHEQRLHQLKDTMTPSQSRKILVVGMVESLQEMYDNKSILEALQSLCWVYDNNNGDDEQGGGGDQDHPHTDRQGFVDIHVLYKRTSTSSSSGDGDGASGTSMDDDQVVSSLQKSLQGWGCRTSFEPEDALWEDLQGEQLHDFVEDYQQRSRYQRLSKLRSLQRKSIVANTAAAAAAADDDYYEIVVNVDFDLVHLPPMLSMIRAIDRVKSEDDAGTGSIICANGYETWNISRFLRPHLFYDTMAAIDATGEWAYSKYPLSVKQYIMFGQTLLLRDILRQDPDLWPMQSCFGGIAIYDYKTWAYPYCDYDQDKIRLIMKDEEAILLDEQSQTIENGLSSSNETTEVARSLRSVKAPPSETFAERLQRRRWNVDPQYTIDGTVGGESCEHVVFQQCLYHSSSPRASDGHRKRPIKIGIQPDLLIERGAAVFSRSEDMEHGYRMIGRIVLVVTLLFILVFYAARYAQNDISEPHGSNKQKMHAASPTHVHTA